MSPHFRAFIFATFILASSASARAAEPQEIAGIYPHLATFNDEGECGTGAVVHWADRLWVISYAPHKPTGSSDKLYEITPDLRQIVRPESIGGTPANRMIHRESQQLFIGPYAIDALRNVRTIGPEKMFGRLTGNARHLTDPAGKIYCATMEEGLYEIDVKTLDVTELWADEQRREGRHANLPGYHGKGLYSGQGRIIYANNGDHAKEALGDPSVPSGALAEWDGKADAWNVVRRNQFTEVTGPGDIFGNAEPARDPVWSIGWDHRSLILMLLDGGKWSAFRLPKASHCYDGAHGWNTEWPRIRDIGEDALLMTMHGTFWRFPKTFSAANSAGIAPRSTYLKVVGDFCRWGDRVVLGCDDTAKSEFLNSSRATAKLAPPGQSQSNLWFIAPERLDRLGPPLGRGAVWMDDLVKAGAPSDAFLFSGYTRRMVHLTHDARVEVRFTFEVDAKGNGEWTKLRDLIVPADGYAWTDFPPEEKGAWVRVTADRDCAKASAVFAFQNADPRPAQAAPIFDGLGNATGTGGLLHARGANLRTLQVGAYELDAYLSFRRINQEVWLALSATIPANVVTVDAASVLYIDDNGARYRLPKSDASFVHRDDERAMREVCTERRLFNAGGSVYELPANNAGGFAKIRPIATHGLHIHDYCSWRGLLAITGISADAAVRNPRITRSEDGRAAVWLGAVDDLWHLGKPRGRGGPWHDSAVKAGEPSDPFLFNGYDKKSLTLSHAAAQPVKMRVEMDIAGEGRWVAYRTFEVPAGKPLAHSFPEAYGAAWVRVVADADCTATAQLTYE